MKYHIIAFFLILIIFLPVLSLGQVSGPGSGGANTNFVINITNPLKCPSGQSQNCSSFLYLLTLVIDNIVMPIASVLVVLYIIYAGFTFITAQGKPQKVEEAKSRLLWALIGAGILLGARGISYVVKNTVESLTN